jgi:hypothetical protein
VHLPGGVMSRESAEAYARLNDTLNTKVIGHPEQAQAHGLLYEGIRGHLFPAVADVARSMEKTVKELLSPDEEGKYQPVPGYKWVDDRTLGYLNKPNPLFSALSSPMVRRFVKGADIINTIQKDMVLYLKPAYAFPNAFGNLFLNFVQQGMFAPFNLARSFRVFSRLHPDTVEKIRQMMGGGVSETLKTPGVGGVVHTVSNKLAGLYGKAVDDPFRFSSFLHEARLSGFKTNAEIEKLMNDPELAETLTRISNRANEEILNYERMGPGEQAVLRRLVFFYPWLKASSRYASYIAKNHPFVAGSSGQLGQMGTQRIEDVLGGLPSYAEGLIPYTGRHGGPFNATALTGNPASFAILQQPADLVNMLMNLIERNPNLGLNAFTNLAPVDKGLLTLGTAGKWSTMKHPVGQPVWQTVKNEIFGGNPLFGNQSSLIEHFTGGPTYPGSIYSGNTDLEALLRFLVTGALTPRLTNIPALNWKAWQQENQTGYIGGNA